MVSLNPTFYVYYYIQFLYGRDGMLIPAHVSSVPQLLQQETVPILVGA